MRKKRLKNDTIPAFTLVFITILIIIALILFISQQVTVKKEE